MVTLSAFRFMTPARRRWLGLLAVLALIGAGLVPGERIGPPFPLSAVGSDSVTVPEHPEGASFNPNEIKDIQVADPGSAVNLIEAPTANNQGEARLTYPIEVPPGRNKVQPQLAVRYSSAGGDGWLGVGWDLPTSAITVDTRWGVPRYDTNTETENYLLDGEQLTPEVNRVQLPARTAEKVFHTRVESQFRRIVRHGTGPTNYWWEITDKSGNRFFYGGAPDTVGPTAEDTLTDAAGDIAMWALRETRDPNDNFMRYHNVRVADGGVANSSVPGVNLYPRQITYTGSGTAEGQYSVTFIRDRDRGEPRRPDVQIDARYGFKKVTADLLRRIEVKLGDQLVRAYELNYRTGAFDKTLLASITQFGSDNTPFNTHTFDYYNDIQDTSGNYDAFGPTTPWSVPDDHLGVALPGDGEAGALSASTTTSTGGHLYVGFNPAVVSKTGSAGAKVGFNSGSSDGLLALIDVNGDNLPDKVFRSGGKIFYRPNLAGPNGQPAFGDAIQLNNLPGISSETTSSGTVGIESYFGVAAQLDDVSTTTTSDEYFSDVNGDGITDLVTNGQVLFGHLDADGHPTYTANSADTPVPIGSGTVSGTLVGDQTAQFQQRQDMFPLMDSVRRWTAPYDGTVRVEGLVRLVQDSPQRVADPNADGVRVTIQHNDTELWAQRIGPSDSVGFGPTGVDAIPVHKGDALYFRVQSVLNGDNDQVAWDPTITYVGVPPSTDVNGLDNDKFQASRDFTLGGRPSSVTAPLTGTLHLSGDVTKSGPTSDDVTVVISRNGTDVYSKVLPGSSAGTAPVNLDIPVTAHDTLSWRLKVDSPIDAGTLSWAPHAFYTSAQGVNTVVDANGNPTLTIDPPYDLDMYPATTLSAPQEAYTATQTGDLTVVPDIAFDFGSSTPDTKLVFTVKRPGELVAKKEIDITGGTVPSPDSLAMTVPVTAGDHLYFDFSTLDTTLPAALTSQSVSVGFGGSADTTVPSALHASVAQGAFAQPYRGWAAIGYQGNRDRATAPIVQSDLTLDQDFRDQLPTGPTPADVPGFTADPQVNQPKITVFAPQPSTGRWAGPGDNLWVAADGVSSSRLGMADISEPSDAQFAGATAVPRIGQSNQISTTLGAGIPGVPIEAGGSAATGTTTGQLDFLDLNGDRFPDVVGSAGVQYSDMSGGLGSTRGSLDGDVRESASTAFNVSAGAGSPARTSATARGQDAPSGNKTANTAESGLEMPALGIGGSLGGGQSDTHFDLIDINADGLPDKVFDNGDVALNLGYSFAAREPWGAGPVNAAVTNNTGVNLGFNTNFYGFAGGVSATSGTSNTNATLMDMNGDGLVDRVSDDGSGTMLVGINTGSGFAPPVAFHGSLSGINSDANTSLGAGAYFTFGFCFVFGCVVFNPGADTSTGIGRTEMALRDVNGDGVVDHVRSTKDNELIVAANRTGRTNLLRSVSRPLGARIDLDYTRDGNTTDSPQSRYVLSRSSVYDGHPGDGQDTQVTTFRYSGGTYNRLEREFYGYRTVTAEQRDHGSDDAIYRTTTDDYRVDSYYTRGLLARQVSADGAGHPFLETDNTYDLRDVDTGGTADPASATATVFPALVRTDKLFYEGQPTAGKTTHTELSYDAFGNVSRQFDAGDDGTADDVETTTGYSSSDPACAARGIVGLPDRVDVRATASGALLRHTESTIDCTTADELQVREFLSDGTAAVTDMTYFPNGNLRSVTDPPNANGQRYRLDYVYDDVVNVHIESVTDSFGYRSTTTHDLRFGLPATTTDENNQQLQLTYDADGRLSSVASPYEVAENRATITFEYHPEAAVPYAVTRHVDRAADGVRPDTIDTIMFIDGLKRTLQTKKDAAVAMTAGATAQDVMTVSGRTVFDFVGRPIAQYYPITESKGSDNTTFNDTFDSVAPTRLSYDILDRTTETVIPNGATATLSYGFGTDRTGATRFETTATDANGKHRNTFADVRKLTTAVQEFNPAANQPVIWTSYGYDALGQLTSVVDDHGNTTTSAYDNLGRRTIVDSPDSGRTETDYDLASDVVAKISATLHAEGKAIQYDYDFNRLADIRYPTFTANDVDYTYGAPGAPNNGANRVVHIQDAAGTVDRSYGPLGELTSETRTVTAISGPPKTFTTSYRFDAFNRMLQMTYPDGEVLTYGYDSGGQVDSASGVKGSFHYSYLARLDYDKFDQRLFMQTGNGVQTKYAYDPADRELANLQSQSPAAGQFQNVSYTYDKVGNILQEANDVPVPTGRPVGGPSTQTYTYDDLYRLTSAQGQDQTAPNKVDSYVLNLSVRLDQRHGVEGSAGADHEHPGQRPGDIGRRVRPSALEAAAPSISDSAPTPAGMDQPSTPDTGAAPAAQPVAPDTGVPPAASPAQTPRAARRAVSPPAMSRYSRTPPTPTTTRYAGAQPHAATTVGPLAKSSTPTATRSTASTHEQPSQRDQMVWDEENRLACTQESGPADRTVAQDPSACDNPGQSPTVRYVYDADGNRVVKDEGPVSIYPNQFYSERTGNAFKEIYIGDTRLLTKTVGSDSSFENKEFYFSDDQLGSTSYVTDESGQLTEHLEYFAGGETWIDENPAEPTPVPLDYNGKELDRNGLYYYGARYYDPRTNLWQSPDPDTSSYLDAAPNDGVFQPFNLDSYTYASDNPIRLTDPDGLSTWNRVVGGLKLVGGVAESAAGAAGGAATSWTGVGAVAGAVVFVHGADVASTGLRQIISGDDESTLTSQAIQTTTGVTKQTADVLDNSVSVVGTLGTSALASAAQAAPIVTTSEVASGSRSGAALARSGVAAEEAVAQRIGVPRNVGPGRVQIGTGPSGYRVPDFDPAATIAARGTVVEVKAVQELSATPQLRALVAYAKSQGVPLEIFTNAKLPASGELARWIDARQVIISPL